MADRKYMPMAVVLDNCALYCFFWVLLWACAVSVQIVAPYLGISLEATRHLLADNPSLGEAMVELGWWQSDVFDTRRRIYSVENGG